MVYTVTYLYSGRRRFRYPATFSMQSAPSVFSGARFVLHRRLTLNKLSYTRPIPARRRTSEVGPLLLAAAKNAVEPPDGQVDPVAHILPSGKERREVVPTCVLQPRTGMACVPGGSKQSMVLYFVLAVRCSCRAAIGSHSTHQGAGRS